jgi:hypothetical protein
VQAVACDPVADQDETVAAGQDLKAEALFDFGEVPVMLAAEDDEKAVVGKFQDRFGGVMRSGRGGQHADAEGGVLSPVSPCG